jgi:hypothetical protein
VVLLFAFALHEGSFLIHERRIYIKFRKPLYEKIFFFFDSQKHAIFSIHYPLISQREKNMLIKREEKKIIFVLLLDFLGFPLLFELLRRSTSR